MFKNKAKTFIELTDNKSVYVANELVSGNLVVDAQEALSFEKIKLKFKGGAKVYWVENDRSSTHEIERERYFEHEITVLESDGYKMIPRGRNLYPFSYRLPTELPSSIEVKGGYVRYMLKAEIDRSGFKSDIKTKTLFTVLDLLDLNHDPDTRNPSTGSDETMMCCWCCASGPIECKLNTDKKGYVPGEFIYFSGSIENKSSRNLPGSSVNLVQLVIKRTPFATRHVTTEVATVIGPKCKRKSSAQFSNGRLQVPPLPPSSLRFCRLMTVEYHLQYLIKTATCKMRVMVPIVIGSVPLQPVPNQTQVPMISTSETQFQPRPNPTQPEMLPSVPPPTYAAATAVKIKTKPEYDGTSSTFAPQYQYYDWNQSASSYN